MCKTCEIISCNKRPHFGFPGKKSRWCSPHKPPGAISHNIRAQCEQDGCKKQPSYGFPGNKARWCSPHKPPGAINLKLKPCESPGCLITPNFAPEGEEAKRCSAHKIKGDVDVKNKTCEGPDCMKRASFAQSGEKARRCASHQVDGDVNVVEQMCESPGCKTQPTFAQPGEKKKRCSNHRINGDINVKDSQCESPGCLKQPCFAQPGEIQKRCATHSLDGDIDVVNKTCEYFGCTTRPSYAQEGDTAKRCGTHRLVGDINVVSKRCSSAACLYYENIGDKGIAKYFNPETGERDLCYSCHRFSFPELHKKLTVRKEQFILAEIQRQLPELESHFLVWDCPLNGCTRKMPDMAWNVEDTLIHVEVDEEGDDHEDNNLRIVDIHAASGLKNHVLIRFNPDRTRDGEEPCLKRTNMPNGDQVYRLYEPEWNRRIPVLIDNVREAFNDALENIDVNTKKRKLFF